MQIRFGQNFMKNQKNRQNEQWRISGTQNGSDTEKSLWRCMTPLGARWYLWNLIKFRVHPRTSDSRSPNVSSGFLTTKMTKEAGREKVQKAYLLVSLVCSP